jgi:hypothetical protein
MIPFYSQVPKVSIKRNRFAHGFPNGVFVDLEIMFAAFGFLHVYDLLAVPLYYNLGFYRVAFFLPE